VANSMKHAVKKTEECFWDIVFSATRQVGERGMMLPKRFNSVDKIYRYCCQYMSPQMAKRLIRNLHLRRINGKLAVPLGDGAGAAPMRRFRVLSRIGNSVAVKATFAFDRNDRYHYLYHLRKKSDHWIVTHRYPTDYPFDLS